MATSTFITIPTLQGNENASPDAAKLSRTDWLSTQDNVVVQVQSMTALLGNNESLNGQDVRIVTVPTLGINSSSVYTISSADVASIVVSPITSGETEFVSMSSVDVYEIPDEEKNVSLITSDNPNSSQGVTSVSWEFFEVVDIEEEEVIASRSRDTTRFRKAYSFTRQQPVRVRFVRR